MAFEKIDFSKLDTRQGTVPDPLDADDARIFANKSLHRTTLDLTWGRRTEASGDIHLEARSEHGERVEVILPGHRAEIFEDGLARDLHKQWVEACDDALEDGGEQPALDALARRIIATGAWRPRKWTDPEGRERLSLRFLLAEWRYQPFGRPAEVLVAEGRAPAKTHASKAKTGGQTAA